MRGKKGFAFSIDAMFALILVIILAGMFMAHYAMRGTERAALESLEKKAGDRAVVALYFGDERDESFASGEFGACAYYFLYDVVQAGGQPDVKKKCEGGFS